MEKQTKSLPKLNKYSEYRKHRVFELLRKFYNFYRTQKTLYFLYLLYLIFILNFYGGVRDLFYSASNPLTPSIFLNRINKDYLIRGYQQGINRVSLPISLIALTPYLTGYLTPSILTSIYKDKKISSNWASFECFFQKLTPSKLTPSISQKNTIKSIKNSSEGVKEKFSVLAGSSLTPSIFLNRINKGYLIRGCEQGTNRVLLPISLVALVP